MRTRMKGRCQLKLTTLGAAKVCFLEENGIARVCEAHFCLYGDTCLVSVGNGNIFAEKPQKFRCQKQEIHAIISEREQALLAW